MSLTITSKAFENEGMIPSKYTCDGENISPPLVWTQAPEGTKSFALISDDPDAPVGTFVHWVIYNIPPKVNELEENFPSDNKLENGVMQGMTDYRMVGYKGPCPPAGVHRYYFKLYALDVCLDIEPGVDKAGLLKTMEGHIVEEAVLMGKYSRES